jgi:hypothetical protein
MFENAPSGFAPMTYPYFDVRKATDRNLNDSAAMLHVVAVTPGVRVIVIRHCGAWTEDGEAVANKEIQKMSSHCSVDMIVTAGWPTDPGVVERTLAFLRSTDDDSFWSGRIMDNPASACSRTGYDDRVYRSQEGVAAGRGLLPVKYTGNNRVFGSAIQEVQHVFDDLARRGFHKYLLIPQNAPYVYGESLAIKYVEPWEAATVPISGVEFTRNGTLRGILLDGYPARLDISCHSGLVRVVKEQGDKMIGTKLRVLRTIMPRSAPPHILGLVG